MLGKTTPPLVAGFDRVEYAFPSRCNSTKFGNAVGNDAGIAPAWLELDRDSVDKDDEIGFDVDEASNVRVLSGMDWKLRINDFKFIPVIPPTELPWTMIPVFLTRVREVSADKEANVVWSSMDPCNPVCSRSRDWSEEIARSGESEPPVVQVSSQFG